MFKVQRGNIGGVLLVHFHGCFVLVVKRVVFFMQRINIALLNVLANHDDGKQNQLQKVLRNPHHYRQCAACVQTFLHCAGQSDDRQDREQIGASHRTHHPRDPGGKPFVKLSVH